MSLSAGARSALTVLVLVLLLLAALLWGWTSVTAPLPTSTAPTEKCVPTEVEKGSTVRPGQVVVSVLNASSREGLAGRTMQLFEDDGYVAGSSGNAPSSTRVAKAQIWAPNPDDPSVQLVRSRLGRGTKVVDTPTTAPGVVVVVGDRFRDLAEGRKAVRVEEDTTICSPPEG